MRSRFKLAVQALLAVGVGSIVLGQLHFLLQQPPILDAALFFVVGAAVFAIVAWIVESPSPDMDVALPEPEERALLGVPDTMPAGPQTRVARILVRLPAAGSSIRAMVVALSVLSALLALRIINGRPATYALPFVLWVGSMVLFVAAWATRPRLPAGMRAWLKAHRWEIAAVGALTAIGFLLRVVSLGSVPQNVSGDEGSVGLEAVNFLQGRTQNMFDLGWSAIPAMWYFLLGGWFRLFGDSIFSLRFVSVLFGTASLVVFYLVLRQSFGVRVALISTIFLTAYHFHLHFSRIGFSNVVEPFFALLALGFLNRGGRRCSPLSYALSGLIAGLAMYLQTGGRLIPLWLAAVLAGDLILRSPRWPRRSPELTALVGAFLIAAGPMLMLAVQRPDDFLSRTNQVNIFRNGWLQNEPRNTGRSTTDILVDQFNHSLFSINLYPDRAAQYKPEIPFLDFPGTLLFLVGFASATLNVANPAYWPFILLFWLTVVLGGAVNLEPPSSARMIQLAPLISLFVGLGLVRVGDIVDRLLGDEAAEDRPALRTRLASVVLPAFLLAWFAASSIYFYFFVYTPRGLFNPGVTEVATRVGYYLRDQDRYSYVYFFGLPQLYFGFSTIPYLSHNMEGVDVTEPITKAPTIARQDQKVIFIFIPSRRPELDVVRRKYPNGQLREVNSTVDGKPLFVAYEVDPRTQ